MRVPFALGTVLVAVAVFPAISATPAAATTTPCWRTAIADWSANGSIEVGSLRRGVATLETAVGDVSCGLADGTAANLDVRSRHGRIRSGLEASGGPAPSDEVVELHAHTTIGDITLYRASDRAGRTS